MESIIADGYGATTLLGSHLGLSNLLPVQFDSKREATLNSYLNIFPNEEFTTTPKMRYFGVGIKGCYNVDDGILSSAYTVQRTNMNLYQLIPIRCRPVDEDLTAEERSLYRLRQRKIINGVECFVYYLKVMEFDNNIKFKRINASGEEEPYELNPEYLEPEPIKPDTSSTIIPDTSSIVAYGEARCIVTSEEVNEYIRMQYSGDTRYSRISEIGFFTGVDKEVSGTTHQGVSFQYTEAIYTMLHTHNTWNGASLAKDGSGIQSTFDITSTGAVTEK